MAVLCPVAGAPGKRVSPVTVRSLVRDEHLPTVEGREWFYCDLPDCDVVYFAPDGETLRKDAIKVRIGAKENAPPRKVCYCFDHTVESIREELDRTGQSTVVASITAKVKAGECRCSTMNPTGTCCLGDVSQVVKECASGATRSRGSHAGLLAVVASLLSALAATACCWLPLLLVALGVSAAGVSAAFERVRPVFVVVAPLLLGAGFYSAYRRRRAEGPEACCADPSPRMRRFHRAMLWACTPIVLGAVFFPDAIFRVVRAGEPLPSVEPQEGVLVLTLRIEGMTCEGCAAHAERELVAVPGVRRAMVDYVRGEAIVGIDPSTLDRAGELLKAIERAGYRGRLISPTETPAFVPEPEKEDR